MTSATPQNRLNAALQAAQQKFQARGGTASGKKRDRPSSRRQWTRQIIKTDRLDQIEWYGNQDELHAWYTSDPIVGIRQHPDVEEAINDLFYGDLLNQEERPGYLNGPELLQDIFFSFLLPVPKMRKKSEVVKDARLNGKFLQQLQDLPVFEEIRDYSITDVDTAAGAMLALVDVIKELIKQHREEVEDANQQRQDAGCDPGGQPGNSDRENWDEEKKQQEGQSSGQSSGESGGDDDGKSQFGDREPGEAQDEQPDWDHREEGDQERPQGSGEQQGGSGDDDADGDDDGENEKIDDVEREFNEELDGEYEDESDWTQIAEQIDFGQMANRALTEFAEGQGELREAMKGIGVTPEQWKLMDPSARLDLAQRLTTAKMRKIADLIGRMKRFAMLKQAQKVNNNPHEIYSIEQGNDLTRTVRQEFALLGTPETELYFYIKFANGELLQYKKRGHEKVGRGPLVVLVDNSGSMSGDPEDWAKGICEALRRIAAEQDRDFYVIFFEMNSHRERFFFPKGKGPWEKVMAYLSITAGGGTQFDGVLTEGLQKAIDFHAGTPQHGKSDLVLITDGEANLNQSWIDNFNAKRHEVGVRVFSIYISAYDSTRSTAMRFLESFSDVAIPAKALEVDDRTTDQLFATI